MDKSESEMCLCTCSSTHLAEKVIGSYPKHNTHPLKIEISAPMEGMIAREEENKRAAHRVHCLPITHHKSSRVPPTPTDLVDWGRFLGIWDRDRGSLLRSIVHSCQVGSHELQKGENKDKFLKIHEKQIYNRVLWTKSKSIHTNIHFWIIISQSVILIYL